jgi:hypothetical protein
MDKAQDELKPLTTVQLLDDAIWREIGSHEPQPPEVFIEALSLLLARWMLTRSQAPEMETLTTRCKTRAYVLFNNTPKLGDVTAQRNEELTQPRKRANNAADILHLLCRCCLSLGVSDLRTGSSNYSGENRSSLHQSERRFANRDDR